jgi:hypothetical protein
MGSLATLLVVKLFPNRNHVPSGQGTVFVFLFKRCSISNWQAVKNGEDLIIHQTTQTQIKHRSCVTAEGKGDRS